VVRKKTVCFHFIWNNKNGYKKNGQNFYGPGKSFPKNLPTHRWVLGPIRGASGSPKGKKGLGPRALQVVTRGAVGVFGGGTITEVGPKTKKTPTGRGPFPGEQGPGHRTGAGGGSGVRGVADSKNPSGFFFGPLPCCRGSHPTVGAIFP